MKKNKRLGVPCMTLTRPDYNELTSQRDKIILPESAYGHYVHHTPFRIFRLNDGRYFYDYKNGGYIFNDRDLLQSYLQKAVASFKRRQEKYDRFQQVKSFCEAIAEHVSKFQNRYDLDLNFDNVNSLHKLNTLINKNCINMDIEYFGLIAVIGNYLTGKAPEIVWRDVALPDNMFYPAVCIGSEIISPIDILEHEIEKHSNGQEVNLLRPIARIIRLKIFGEPN